MPAKPPSLLHNGGAPAPPSPVPSALRAGHRHLSGRRKNGAPLTGHAAETKGAPTGRLNLPTAVVLTTAGYISIRASPCSSKGIWGPRRDRFLHISRKPGMRDDGVFPAGIEIGDGLRTRQFSGRQPIDIIQHDSADVGFAQRPVGGVKHRKRLLGLRTDPSGHIILDGRHGLLPDAICEQIPPGPRP